MDEDGLGQITAGADVTCTSDLAELDLFGLAPVSGSDGTIPDDGRDRSLGGLYQR